MVHWAEAALPAESAADPDESQSAFVAPVTPLLDMSELDALGAADLSQPQHPSLTASATCLLDTELNVLASLDVHATTAGEDIVGLRHGIE